MDVEVKDVEMKMEELQNPNEITYETDFKCGVTVKGFSTSKAFSIVKSLIPELEEVNEIIHYRKRKNGFYRTIINGYFFSIDVHSGFTSGYGGAGPSGFYKLLVEELGINEEQAKIVFESKYENAVIKIKRK